MKYLSLIALVVVSLTLTACNKGLTTTDETNEVPSKTEAHSTLDKDADFVGLSVEESQQLAEMKDVPFRVVMEDGQSLPAIMDYRPGRINATVEAGKVTSYEVEGQEQTTEEIEYTGESWKTMIPETCMAFFDGCNNCHRAPDSDMAACTRKFCQQYQMPKCLDEDAQTEDGEVMTVTVGPELVDCVGVGPMKCLIVDGQMFYDQIEGFELEPGFEYQLEIIKTPREEPIPADAGSHTYNLKSVLEKTPVESSTE